MENNCGGRHGSKTGGIENGNISAKYECLSEFMISIMSLHLVLLCSLSIVWKGKRGHQPQYSSCALLKHISGKAITPWRRILTLGTDADFIVTTNLTIQLTFGKILLAFTQIRQFADFGSPYRRTNTRRRYPLLLDSVDLVGLVLLFLKSKDNLYRLCPVFGGCPIFSKCLAKLFHGCHASFTKIKLVSEFFI